MTQLFALLISWSIEVPVVLMTLAKTQKFSSYRDIYTVSIVACLATLFTHPLAWESNQTLIPYMAFPLRIAAIEGCVAIAEGIVYAILFQLDWQKSFLLSLFANGSSCLIGLLIANFWSS